MGRQSKHEQWVPNQTSESSVVAWRAAAPQIKKGPGLSVMFLVLNGLRGASGKMGLGTANKVYTGDSANQLMGTQQSALRDARGEVAASQERGTAAYEFACLDLSKRLTTEDEARLRATGELPDWFLPALRQSAAEVRRRRKS